MKHTLRRHYFFSNNRVKWHLKNEEVEQGPTTWWAFIPMYGPIEGENQLIGVMIEALLNGHVDMMKNHRSRLGSDVQCGGIWLSFLADMRLSDKEVLCDVAATGLRYHLQQLSQKDRSQRYPKKNDGTQSSTAMLQDGECSRAELDLIEQLAGNV